ncbi:MAG: hypothetical protein GC182_22725 [Rhodopseudomonas sp.]|nr:hypothetical protein [Rhodopseudomonas sp.]
MARDNEGASISKFGTQLSELMKLADTSTLWHIAGWGGATTFALAVAALISTTNIGTQRLQTAFAPEATSTVVAGGEAPRGVQMARTSDDDRTGSISRQRQVVTPIPQSVSPADTARLEAEIRQLAADRDRLKQRVASLEQNLNDMTGSIKRELALVASTASAAPPAIAAPPTQKPTESGRAEADKMADAKGDTGEETARQVNASGKADARTNVKSEARFVSKPDAPSSAKPEPVKEARAEPAPEAKLTSAPGLPVVTLVPLPPIKAGSAPPPVEDPNKPAIGIELGGARSMEILKKRWAAVKLNFGPLIEGMHPLVTYDRRNHAIPYRLKVGPLANGAGAAALCKRFAASRVSCRTVEFVGDVFAEK